jgi:hypothetical protein
MRTQAVKEPFNVALVSVKSRPVKRSPGSAALASDKSIYDIRFENFQLLFSAFKVKLKRDFPGEPDRGMLRKFASRAGLDERYASHLNVRRKTVGSNTARSMETALGLPVNFMDHPHPELGEEAVIALLEGRKPELRQVPSQGAMPGLPDLSTDKGLETFVKAAVDVYRWSPERAQAAMVALLLERLSKGGKDDGNGS